MHRHRRPWCSLCLVLCCSIGCSGRKSRLAQPGIEAGAAEAAIAEYDTNGDGAIGGDELNKVPALKASLKRADKNGDGKISADEIDERLAVWKNSQLALTRVVAVVRQGGRPLPDAEVTLVPEKFLGPDVKAAKGTTDATGSVHLKISTDPDEAGVHLGYYRVEVSKKKADGSEAIPARFNSETEFGLEVAPDDPNLDRVVLDMSSR